MLSPVAPIAAQAWGVRGYRALLIGAGLALRVAAAFTRDEATSFDIPAQPLSSALEAFSSASGYQILMSETVVESWMLACFGKDRSSLMKAKLHVRNPI